MKLHRCAISEIGGDPGIFTRSGWWYSIGDRMWNTRQAVPSALQNLTTMPNSMFTFGGRATVFGSPRCDALGQCVYDQVIQYRDDLDQWVSIGYMAQERDFHSVVEVPKEFCELIS